MGYQYDIFISYKRNDLGRQWLQRQFIPELKKRLESLHGPVNIFLDESVQEGAIPRQAVLQALQQAKILMPILSPPYFQSHWCSAEWKTFEARELAAGLIDGCHSLRIPIRWRDCEKYDTLMGDSAPKPRDFHEFRHTEEGWRKSEKFTQFEEEVDKLADLLACLLPLVHRHDPDWPLVTPEASTPLHPDMAPTLSSLPRL